MKKEEIMEAKNLNSKTLTELLELEQALICLIEYYDNYARANEGIYEFNAAEIYERSRKLSSYYNEIRISVIEAIEKKVKEEVA